MIRQFDLTNRTYSSIMLVHKHFVLLALLIL